VVAAVAAATVVVAAADAVTKPRQS
jgi:hypothetical protein